MFKAHAAIGLAVALWGSSFVATKWLLNILSPVALVSTRFLATSIIFAILSLSNRPKSSSNINKFPSLPIFGNLLILGLLGLFIHQYMQAYALKTSMAMSAGWIIATVPVFTAILARIFLKEQFTLIMAGGTILAVCGTILVVAQGMPISSLTVLPSTIGDLLLLASAANWAINSIVSKVTLKHLSPIKATMFSYWISLIPLLPIFIKKEMWQELALLPVAGWIAIIHLIINCSIIAHVAWYFGLSRLSTATASSYLYLEPLVTTVAAIIYLGEPLKNSMLIGGILILIGVTIINRKQETSLNSTLSNLKINVQPQD